MTHRDHKAKHCVTLRALEGFDLEVGSGSGSWFGDLNGGGGFPRSEIQPTENRRRRLASDDSCSVTPQHKAI